MSDQIVGGSTATVMGNPLGVDPLDEAVHSSETPSTERVQFSVIGSYFRLAFGILVLFVLLPVTALAALLFLPWQGIRVRIGNLFAKAVLAVAVPVLGSKVIVHNREGLTRQRAIFIANHSSTMDVWVGSGICPMGGCGTAKKETIYVPVFGQLFWLCGHLLLDRGNTEKAKAAMRSLSDRVHKNKLSIWVWPDGTRSRDGRLQPLKKGFVHLACATGLPVVPIVIEGAHKRWPAKTWRLSPGEIHCRVLDPIDTSDWKPSEAGMRAQQLWQVFKDNLPEDQKPLEDPAA